MLQYLRAGLPVLVLLAMAGTARGQGAILGLGDPGDARSTVGVEGLYQVYEETDVQDQDSVLQISEYELSVRTLLWRNKPLRPPVKRPGAAGADATEKPPVPPDPQAVAAARRKAMMGLKQVHFTVDYQYLSLDGGAVLPDSNVALPEDLHDIKGSVSYSHMFEPRRLWGFRASIGSASDSPFASSDVIAVNGLGFYMHPSRKRDAWVFFLHYSNTRSLLNHVPLPGVAYFWRPNREFQLLAGIPFLFARWRPTKQWEFSVLGTPAPSGTVQAKFRPSRAAELYAALRLAVGDGFLREDREEDRERLYASANRAELGADIHLSRHLRLGVAGGYAFDRFIYEGEGFDERDENRIDLNDAAYGLVRLKARW